MVEPSGWDKMISENPDHFGPTRLVDDLGELDLPARGISDLLRFAGLRVVLELASGDIRPMTAEAEFIVALLARAPVADNGSSR